MVDFVEESARKRAVSFNANRSAVFEQGFDADFGWARNESVDLWDGKTAFVVFFYFTVGFNNFWVEKGGEVGVFLVVEIVADDNDAFIEP